MDNLKSLFNREGLLAVHGMKTELGYKTKRFSLDNINEALKWLESDSKNSLKFIYDNEEPIEFKVN